MLSQGWWLLSPFSFAYVCLSMVVLSLFSSFPSCSRFRIVRLLCFFPYTPLFSLSFGVQLSLVFVFSVRSLAAVIPLLGTTYLHANNWCNWFSSLADQSTLYFSRWRHANSSASFVCAWFNHVRTNLVFSNWVIIIFMSSEMHESTLTPGTIWLHHKQAETGET